MGCGVVYPGNGRLPTHLAMDVFTINLKLNLMQRDSTGMIA